MKKILFLFCVVYTLNSIAQEQGSYDERLLYRFDQATLEAFVETNPSKIDYLNFYLDNAFYVQDVSEAIPEKWNVYPDIKDFLAEPNEDELDLSLELENINILKYNVQFFENKENVFRYGDTGKLIILRSKSEIYHLYNQN